MSDTSDLISPMLKTTNNNANGKKTRRAEDIMFYMSLVGGILTVILVIVIIIMSMANESFYNPTLAVTLYFRSNSPDSGRVLLPWSVFVRNAQSDGKFIVRSIDCDDPNNAGLCKNIGQTPVIYKRQAGGQVRMFVGTNTASSFYHFANMDY